MEDEKYRLIIVFLIQTGVSVIIDEEIDQGCGEFNCITRVMQLPEKDLKTLAHECVHWLQLITPMEGLDPLEFNQDLTPSQVSKIENHVRKNYPQDQWKKEIPAYSLEEDPDRILLIINDLQKQIDKGCIKVPKAPEYRGCTLDDWW